MECKFESRLKFEPVANVEALNAACLAWQNAFNANLIPRQDNRLAREGMAPRARLDLWRTIKPEELRLLPPMEACRALLAGNAVERPVRKNLVITYKHPRAERTRRYSVAGLDGVCVGDVLTVRPLLCGDCAIRISLARYDGADLVYRLEAEAPADEFGQHALAPVIGQEYRAVPHVAAAKAGKRLDNHAWPGMDEAQRDKARDRQAAPFGGQLNAHSHLADITLPTALPRRGIALTVPGTIEVEDKPLSPVAVAAWCASHVLDWDSDKYRQLMAWYPEGVREVELDQVAERFQRTPRLYAVGAA